MSTAPSRQDPSRRRDPAYRRPDLTRLHARRRDARQRRTLARVDVAIGVAVALFVLLVSPGLAVTGIVALLALATVGISVVRTHRRRRPGAKRGGRRERTSAPRAASGGVSRQGERSPRGRATL
jgi:Flp pilus assembly protein TadB